MRRIGNAAFTSVLPALSPVFLALTLGFDENSRVVPLSVAGSLSGLLVVQIVRDVREMARENDFVFTTGGVGPTHDDVTMAAIAQAFERLLVRHPLLEAILRAHYGSGITAEQLRIAEVPEGSRLVGEGDFGFPVVAYENVFIFPGIPESVQRKFARIREQFREAPYVLRRIYLRCDEGEIAADLYRTMDRFPALQLGSYPILHNPDHSVLLTLESKEAEEVEQALRFLLERLPASIIVRVE